MNIIGFDITVPVFTVREGNIERLARPDEVKNIHNNLQQTRSMITEAKRKAGIRGIKIKIQGMPEFEAPKQMGEGLPPPPPPPGMTNSLDLPPPPPPPSF